MADAADFRFAVQHGVEADALAVFFTHAARLAEVDVAGQFADDQDVQPGHHFRLQRRGIGQFRIKNRRTQVGEQVQILADAEQAALRALLARQAVPLRAADGTEQHGIGCARQLLGRFRIRVAGRVDRATAEQRLFHLELEIEGVQNTHRLGGDFGTDAVTRQNTNLHVVSLLREQPGLARCGAFLRIP